MTPPEPTARELHVRQVTTVDTDQRCAPGANITVILYGIDECELFWQAIDNANNTATAIQVRDNLHALTR